MTEQNRLEQYRQELLDVDARIIELISKRKEVVLEIGRLKSRTDNDLRNFAMEKRVIENADNKARELDISPGVARDIIERLTAHSLALQEKVRVKDRGKGSGKTALVIGGRGKIGEWFALFLESQGFNVVIADPLVKNETGVQKRRWESFKDQFDITVVAAPLGISAKILEDLADKKSEGLIFDVASLKTPVKNSLKKLKDAGCKVTSVHPMFGPDTEMLAGRHVIFMDVGNRQAVEEAKELFVSTMASCVEMTLDEHDKLVAFVLGLSHLLNISFFTALANSGEQARRLSEISSTSFDAQLKVAHKISTESPHLYYEIQRLNQFRHSSQEALTTALKEIIAAIENDDEELFVQFMEQGRNYLKTLTHIQK